MIVRFSIKAFVLATAVHLIGTVALYATAVYLLFAHIFSPTPRWPDVLSWLWIPGPALLSCVLPNYYTYQTYYLISWSLSVGIALGLLAPYVSRLIPHHLTRRSS
jgi:hypothetical protein